MIITHYLKYLKEPEKKSRFNLIAYSFPAYDSDYFNPLSKPFIYIGNNPNIKANSKRKSDLQISWNGKNLSSMYFFDIDNPGFAYGDINKTRDFIIFIKQKDILELFILTDKVNHSNAILDLLINNELTKEMNNLRESAIIFNQSNLLEGQ